MARTELGLRGEDRGLGSEETVGRSKVVSTCLTKILLVTSCTRNSIGTHLRGKGRVDVNQAATENVDGESRSLT